MAAKKNNQLWKFRSKHGRNKIFSSPEVLWKEACKYFEWCDKNPLQGEKAFSTGIKMTESKMMAYTLSGLCYFLKIEQITFKNYGELESHKEFHETVRQIEQVIYTQKFTGAAAGLLNANIISRDLGLKDASDITSNGESLQSVYQKALSSNENDPD